MSILFTLPTEFDPRGPQGHLYLHAARELVKQHLGGEPPRLGTFALVPASMLGDTATAPIDELAAAWHRVERS